jgi:hypothetical protein
MATRRGTKELLPGVSGDLHYARPAITSGTAVIGGFGHEALWQVERAQGLEELKPLRERLEAEGKTRLLRVVEAFLER